VKYLERSDWFLILRVLSEILIVVGFSLLVLGFVSLLVDRNIENIVFLLPGALCMSLSYYLKRYPSEKNMEMKHAFIISAITWIIIPLFCSVPFILFSDWGVLNSYFEAMSAFTGSGLTMIQNLDSRSASFLFFRSGLAWIGGVGIIVLFLLILKPSIVISKLYSAEARVFETRIKPNIKGTIKEIWKIYLFFSVIAALVLILLGMSPFDGLTHAMTALATQGFSSHDNSLGYYYNNFPVQIAIMIFMIIGATSFLVLFQIKEGNFKAIFRNSEFKFMLFLIFIGIIVVFVNLVLIKNYEVEDAIKSSSFQVVSAVTSTGFGNTDINKFDESSKLTLIILMLVGGCAGSTAGGLKIFKVMILVENSWIRIKRALLSEKAIVPIKLMGKPLTEEEISYVSSLILLFIVVYLAGVMVFLYFGYSTIDSMFVCASALSDNGLNTLSGASWFDMNPFAKVILIFLMYAGRLEILPVLVLIFAVFTRYK